MTSPQPSTAMPPPRPGLTQKQVSGWDEAITRLRASGAEVPADIRSWTVDYADEIRPGRGHSINAQYVDGEVYAQVLMDVYGYPNTAFATLGWVHNDSDDECACAPCTRYRADDEAL